jgi:hypothetical protein
MSDSGSTKSTVRQPAPLSKGRAAVFAVALAFIVAGPLSRQFLGVKTHHLRAWWMFSGIGIGAMDVRFFEREPNGSESELDPFDALGRKRPKKVRERRLKGSKSVLRVASRICKRLGPGADLRVRGRRATRAGWVHDFRGEHNLCDATRDRRTKRGKRERRKR